MDGKKRHTAETYLLKTGWYYTGGSTMLTKTPNVVVKASHEKSLIQKLFGGEGKISFFEQKF